VAPTSSGALGRVNDVGLTLDVVDMVTSRFGPADPGEHHQRGDGVVPQARRSASRLVLQCPGSVPVVSRSGNEAYHRCPRGPMLGG